MGKHPHFIGYIFIGIGFIASVWLLGGMFSLLPLPFSAYGAPFGIKVLATFSVGGWCAAAICYRDDFDE